MKLGVLTVFQVPASLRECVFPVMFDVCMMLACLYAFCRCFVGARSRLTRARDERTLPPCLPFLYIMCTFLCLRLHCDPLHSLASLCLPFPCVALLCFSLPLLCFAPPPLASFATASWKLEARNPVKKQPTASGPGALSPVLRFVAFFVLSTLPTFFALCRRGFPGARASRKHAFPFGPSRRWLLEAVGFQIWTVWPSGLRRWLKAPFRKGVGSNPTAVIWRTWGGSRLEHAQPTLQTCSWGGMPSALYRAARNKPAIAQLVGHLTVELAAIRWSLVRFRVAGLLWTAHVQA